MKTQATKTAVLPEYPAAPALSPLALEKALDLIKTQFAAQLADELNLHKVSAPLLVKRGSGLNDDLNGSERPVHFAAPALDHQTLEIVHSLAKWKRLKLARLGLPAGQGILTNMRAIRADEVLSSLHSLFVDQWDWEKVIRPEERSLDVLKDAVRAIYRALLATAALVDKELPGLAPQLPHEITFVHTEDLQRTYPHLSPKQREDAIAKALGAVFLIGIGGRLQGGEPHDGRAPDYDDWSSPSVGGYQGLNGDILLWNEPLGRAFELSSMGIRVDAGTLQRQLAIRGCQERAALPFHAALLAGELPQTLGGGIGQSRLCMFLLGRRHIGEVQASLWPDQMADDCVRKGLQLL
ncbi:aspartate--ammonia ligase [Cesiribacter andamanensis]|uniref:Aspartate--ammonia ligase n=1 Tax=Cesiribacter andamanensis AMV16 TaxID=1279009 RepID=M7NYB4_9BACT|nr:aspartate--ammonia ligase [Cesiribacter andamanensis]EMR03369.1 Aspartate--ammonia ligase [Cesiribacter andamanensis AMV16]